MPRIKTTQPMPDKNKGQRSIDIPDIPLYLPRVIPGWNNPGIVNSSTWRAVVERQPFASICRDYLIDNILALDWKIEPKDSEKRDELKSDIDYYTDFLNYTGDYSYDEIVSLVLTDLLTIPFGGAVELGRENDAPDGKVVWIEPMDGGTLFPTFQHNFPIGQSVPEAIKVVYFPYYAVDRIYLSPRPELQRKGWGIAPPEKVYMALELISRGDYYYANLLLDTPEVGILDLMDMSTESATKWVTSWREMLQGIDPFKIPVLYEHEKPVNFIPFQRSPTEIMYDKALMRYGAIVAAGYGITLGDIGFQSVSSGGETLAGSIRSERRTRKTGLAVVKKKIKFFFDRIVPDTLSFIFIDLDDEVSTAIGRARLATSTAFGQLIDKKVFTPKETRLQMIADGLVTISVPEEIPMDEFPAPPPNPFNPLGGNQQNQAPERPSMLGRPVAPSSGGQGEIRNSLVQTLSKAITNTMLLRFAHDVYDPISLEYSTAVRSLGVDGIRDWETWHDDLLSGSYDGDIPDVTIHTLGSSIVSVRKSLTNTLWSLEIKSWFDSVSKELELISDTDLKDVSYVDILSEVMADEICRFSLAVVRSFLIHTDGDTFTTLLMDENFGASLRECYNKACYSIADKFLSKLYDIILASERKDNNNAKTEEVTN